MKSNHFAALSIVAMFAIPLLVGCEVKPTVQPRQDPYPREQVHLASNDLRSRTAVDTPQVRRDDAGLLYVTVPIRAASDLQLYIDYRVTFFDQDGRPLGEPTGWIPKTLTPRVPDQIMVNSTTPLAKDFQVDIRYSQ
jgi:Protein of unknown function (DUF1425)